MRENIKAEQRHACSFDPADDPCCFCSDRPDQPAADQPRAEPFVVCVTESPCEYTNSFCVLQLGQAVTKNPGYLKLRKIRAAQNIAKTV